MPEDCIIPNGDINNVKSQKKFQRMRKKYSKIFKKNNISSLTKKSSNYSQRLSKNVQDINCSMHI